MEVLTQVSRMMLVSLDTAVEALSCCSIVPFGFHVLFCFSLAFDRRLSEGIDASVDL